MDWTVHYVQTHIDVLFWSVNKLKYNDNLRMG